MSFKISVIIPTFNRSRSLREALKHLENQSYKEIFEVIVVDDWSTDNTVNMLQLYGVRKFKLTIISQENRKQWAARNNWVDHCSGSLIIFIQDDIWVSENFLLEHANFHIANLDENIVSIWNTHWTKDLQNDKFHQFLDWSTGSIFPSPLFDYWSLIDWKQTDFFHFYTNNLAIKKSFFQKERFDEKFNSYGWEDIELWFRLYKRWMKIYYVMHAIWYHNHEYTFENFLDREKKVALNKGLLIKLHPDIIKYFHFSLVKNVLFKILSIKPLLLLYKMVNSEMYYYFSWKSVQR